MKEQKYICTLNYSESMIPVSMHPPWNHVSLMFVSLSDKLTMLVYEVKNNAIILQISSVSDVRYW